MTDCRRIWRSERNEDREPLQRRSSCVICLGLSQLPNQGIGDGAGVVEGSVLPRGEHNTSFQSKDSMYLILGVIWPSEALRGGIYMNPPPKTICDESHLRYHSGKIRTRTIWHHCSFFLKRWHFVISQPWTQLWGRRWVWQRRRTVWIVWELLL